MTSSSGDNERRRRCDRHICPRCARIAQRAPLCAYRARTRASTAAARNAFTQIIAAFIAPRLLKPLCALAVHRYHMLRRVA